MGPKKQKFAPMGPKKLAVFAANVKLTLGNPLLDCVPVVFVFTRGE